MCIMRRTLLRADTKPSGPRKATAIVVGQLPSNGVVCNHLQGTRLAMDSSDMMRECGLPNVACPKGSLHSKMSGGSNDEGSH
jgi:hypothetical protein